MTREERDARKAEIIALIDGRETIQEFRALANELLRLLREEDEG